MRNFKLHGWVKGHWARRLQRARQHAIAMPKSARWAIFTESPDNFRLSRFAVRRLVSVPAIQSIRNLSSGFSISASRPEDGAGLAVPIHLRAKIGELADLFHRSADKLAGRNPAGKETGEISTPGTVPALANAAFALIRCRHLKLLVGRCGSKISGACAYAHRFQRRLLWKT